jgi:hypothetical protein
MKPITYKKLQEFVGKVCSILTTAVAKPNFSDLQFNDFFVGIIEEISEDGIFSKHPSTGCLSFYSWPQVVGVFQEQVVPQDDPEYQNILSELKKAPPEQINVMPVNPQASGSQFVDPEVMASLAKQAKEIQQKMNK